MNKRRWACYIGIPIVCLVVLVFVVLQVKHVNADRISVEKLIVERGQTLVAGNLIYSFGEVQNKVVKDELGQEIMEYWVPVQIKNESKTTVEVPLADFVALYSNYKSGLYSGFLENGDSVMELMTESGETKKGHFVFSVYMDKYIEQDNNFQLYF